MCLYVKQLSSLRFCWRCCCCFHENPLKMLPFGASLSEMNAVELIFLVSFLIRFVLQKININSSVDVAAHIMTMCSN